jgi:hypothetical protein
MDKHNDLFPLIKYGCPNAFWDDNDNDDDDETAVFDPQLLIVFVFVDSGSSTLEKPYMYTARRPRCAVRIKEDRNHNPIRIRLRTYVVL